MARNDQPQEVNSHSSVQVEEGRAPMPRFAPGEFDQKHVAPDTIPLPVVQGGAAEGRTLWRSPEEKAERALGELNPAMDREFPMGAADFASDGLARRSFIQLLGSSLAVAGVSGCAYRPPDEKILPYTVKPEAVTPSSPLHFATTSTLGGLASGLLVRSYEGRPVKVEGNPLHPSNPGGGSNAFEQAETLRLYDPHRAKEPKQGGSSKAWKAFLEDTSRRLEKLKAGRGAGLRFLMEPNGSPLLASLKTRILEERFPLAKFYSYAPVSAASAYEGAKLAFGQALDTDYDLKQAKVVLSLDADFLASFPGCQRLTHAFMAGREPGPNMNRLYAAESNFSVTGAFADHRLRVKPSELSRVAVAVAIELERLGAAELRSLGLKAVDGLSEAQRKWATAVAKDLYAHRGAGAVLVGARQPAALHALAQALNVALGGGKVVQLRKPLMSDSGFGIAGLRSLAAELEAGKVDTLIVTSFNPVYSAPADLRLGELLAKVPNVIYWGMHEDETAKAAKWFVPAAHFLEAWGDAVGSDGTASLVQPLIKPLFSGVTEADLLAACLNQNDGTYALLKDFWKKKVGSPLDFETRWEGWLAEGRIPATEVTPESGVDLRGGEVGAAVQRELLSGPAMAAGSLELNIVPDYKLLDGRFGNSAWLQELPDPITKITWDNVAYLSDATAQRLEMTSGDVVTLSGSGTGHSVEAPVWVLPGHADDTVTVSLGYGRSEDPALVSEKVARGVGFDAYLLQPAATPWGAVGLQLAKTGKKHKLASTQEHWSIHLESGAGGEKKVSETRERDIAMETTLANLQQNPELYAALRGPQPTMYSPANEGTYRWAMSTDLSKCTGCNACVVACQSENNVPVVGKEGISRGREMHWLRIDRYFSGSVEDPGMISQPLACVHCEMAPCEYVCPVNATVHDDEGLNEMIYNRCIGTRYCSNNCPYKVRRFNFLAYNTEKSETEKMGMNPEVTVRARGVMEKCTYCVQRIESKRIETRIQGRRIKDGELTPACAQACSGDALVFGDLNDSESRVSKLHKDPRRYDLLHHLATNPRTAYLARIKNPNPELA